MVVPETAYADSNDKSRSSGQVWPAWHSGLAAYQISDSRKAVWQLINTFVPYFFLCYLMIRSIQLGYPYALTLLLSLPASAFALRIFILFHDCVHGSLFPSRSANTFFGYLCGVLVLTPFEDWRYVHLRHHVTYANLDARGFGDIRTMTLTEYENSPKWKQLLYRFYRHPVVLIGLGPFLIFLLSNRLPTRKVRRKERVNVLFTNLLIVGVALVAARVMGWRTYLLIQLPVVWLGGAAGIWLFYVQHQFKGVYWARKDEWDALRAAMEGSSFYELPAVLRWFSGNIGYHHVHHLKSRIPNYRLKECYDAVGALQARTPITIVKSLSCARLKVWDEGRHVLIGFK